MLDRGQDIEAASAESSDDGVLTGILVHIETHFAHVASPRGVPWSLNSSYRASAAVSSDSISARLA